MSSQSCDLRGLAQLDISISELDDPCKTSNRTWYVTIFNCDGSVLEYCSRKYIVIPASCGTLSVRLPPGRYVVGAVWSYTINPSGGYQANHFTDRSVVTVCCNSCHCVTLFNPHVHRCGQIYLKAANDLMAQGAIDNAQFTALQGAMQPILDAAPLPNPGAQFDLDPQVDALAALRDQNTASGLGNAINPIQVAEPLATDLVAAIQPPPA